MNRDEVLKKIEEARSAIKEYKSKSMATTFLESDEQKVELIKKSSEMLILEARTIGAGGTPCPTCGGSGRA